MFITIPDYLGNDELHSISDLLNLAGVTSPSPAIARTLFIKVITPNSGPTNSRIGDQNVSGVQGVPIGNTTVQVFPELPLTGSPFYGPELDLSSIYLWAAANEVISITMIA